MRSPLFLLIAPAVLAFAIACETPAGSEVTPAPTPSVGAPTPTAMAPPTPTPAATPKVLTESKVVFMRGLKDSFPLEGVLWMGNLDSTEQEQITPDGMTASFVGLDSADSGKPLIYYLARDGEKQYTLWQLDTATGERASIVSFEAPRYRLGEADVSPDGRYVAYTDARGLQLLDRINGRQRLVLPSSEGPCESGPRDCWVYDAPQWSRDGRLLLVSKGFYEGAIAVVVDPFASPPVEHTYRSISGGPSHGDWSQHGDALCAYGLYAAPSGLYVAEAPDWSPRNLLPEFEIPGEPPDFEERWVWGCAFLSPDRILFANALHRMEGDSPRGTEARLELSVYDLSLGVASTVAELEPTHDDIVTPNITILPGSDRALLQYFRFDGAETLPSRPMLVDFSTGSVTPVFQDGDWIVAVVAPPGFFPDMGGPPPAGAVP